MARIRSLFPVLGVLTAVTTLSTPALAHRWYDVPSMKDAAAFGTALWNIDAHDKTLDAWAVEPDGDWILVSGTEVWHSSGMDATFVTGVKWNIVFGRRFQAMDCRADGLCVGIHTMGVLTNGTAPSSLTTTANDWISVKRWAIRDLELTSGGGWLLLGPGSNAAYSGLPSDLSKAVYDRRASDRQIADVSIGFSNQWALIADNNPMSDGAPAGMRSRMDSNAASGWTTEKIQIGKGSDWIMLNADDERVMPDLTDPVQAMEYGLGPGANVNIWKRMSDYGVSGVGIAYIEDAQVVSSRGYGVLRTGDDRPILASSPWDVASLSKYVGALTTLAVMEGTPGLDLDDDAIAAAGGSGTVVDWADRHENERGSYGFPTTGISALPEGGITYRQLLSHTGGMVERGSTPIPVMNQDTWADQTTLAFLSGYMCYFSGIAGDCTWGRGGDLSSVYYRGGFIGAPGVQYNYSNAGFYLAQASLEDITGDEGETLMRDELFAPMGLADTTGQYPLPASFLSRRVNAHDASGPQAEEATYPWTFAGGVTASVHDYAELVILALNEGKSSDGTRILAKSSIEEMLTRVDYANFDSDPNPSRYGLGVGIANAGSDDYAGDDDGRFAHTGSHPGRVMTFMCGNPTRRDGVVIFINQEDGLDAGEGGMDDFRQEIRDAFNAATAWPTGC